ncbi:MAG: hypothetical protein M3Y55_03215 [Pseudomonadota bacterium]|nr:hypothetical protein [Pseudomonadota bacterium]
MHKQSIRVVALALSALTGAAHAFNPMSEPPGFGIVSVNADQTIRLNVVCWEHDVDGVPPRPCDGELMFHDMAGNVVARQIVRLRPGGAAYLDYSVGPRTSPAALVGINPCWIPAPTSGRSLPTAEVFDSASGRVAAHVNPSTPNITLIGGGR